ncbi:hypothetical protein D3C71_1439530 [compost metagenome]
MQRHDEGEQNGAARCVLHGAVKVGPGGERIAAQLLLHEQTGQCLALIRLEREHAPGMKAAMVGGAERRFNHQIHVLLRRPRFTQALGRNGSAPHQRGQRRSFSGCREDLLELFDGIGQAAGPFQHLETRLGEPGKWVSPNHQFLPIFRFCAGN